MKRFISIFVILALFFAPAATAVSAQTSEYILGDVNNDGIVSICDATTIQRHLAQFEQIPEERLKAAMVCDGKTHEEPWRACPVEIA